MASGVVLLRSSIPSTSSGHRGGTSRVPDVVNNESNYGVRRIAQSPPRAVPGQVDSRPRNSGHHRKHQPVTLTQGNNTAGGSRQSTPHRASNVAGSSAHTGSSNTHRNITNSSAANPTTHARAHNTSGTGLVRNTVHNTSHLDMGQSGSVNINSSAVNRNQTGSNVSSEPGVPVYTSLPPYSQTDTSIVRPTQRHSLGPNDTVLNQRSDSIQRLGSTEHIVNITDDRRLLAQNAGGSNLSLDVVGTERHRVNTTDLNPGITRVDSGTVPAPESTLPDLLNSHALPPPYRSGRSGSRNSSSHDRNLLRLRSGTTHDASRRERSRRRRHRRSRTRQRRSSSTSPDNSTEHERFCCTQWCCLSCLTVFTRFRWVLFSLALLGICCVVAGVVLGALHMTGSSFLTLSLMFIGLGIMLVIVVALGWKCTPRDHEPCHLLFGLGIYSSQELDRRLRRAYRRRERGPQWYAGSMYPEFRYRRPPPSYNAAMQDYNQQVNIAAHTMALPNPQTEEDTSGLPSSPPPTYRSQVSVRPGIHITYPADDDFPTSRPPTYRSHISTVGHGGHQRPALDMNNDTSSTVLPSTSDQSTNTSHQEPVAPNTSLHTTTITIMPGGDVTTNNNNEETTLSRGFKIVERLDNMLDATLRSMDNNGTGSDVTGDSSVESVDPDTVSVVVPEDTQL